MGVARRSRSRDRHHSSCLLTTALVPSLRRLAHYCRLRDVQTLAMLCSVFEAQSRPQGIPNPFGPFPSRSANLVVSHSRYVSWGFPGLNLAFCKGQLSWEAALSCCSRFHCSPALHPQVPARACPTRASTLVAGK